MSQSGPAQIAPVDDDGVVATIIGVIIWAVALFACLVGRDSLAERGKEWWLWTCAAGLGYGLGMVVVVRRRASAYRAHRERLGGPGTQGATDPAGE